MPATIPITTLEIIGYADRLTNSMLPAIVPPVFRLNGESGPIFLPPYSLRDGMLSGSVEVPENQIQKLDGNGDITLFSQPIRALPDHELWVDLDAAVHYEQIRVASAALKALAADHLMKAKEELAAGRHDAAETHCRIALRADDRLMEPLAISAAIARQRNIQSNVRLMTKLAEGYLSPEGFEYLVSGFSGLISAGSVTGEMFEKHKISGMAAIKPTVLVSADA